ncbi:transposase, partial [Endozoicomonas atrinae]|uniref:transposase n=1 Tax=Endozoicomonas atrinae TaxID=1333660 RepID=UPI001EE76268
EAWGEKFPSIGKSWRNNWDNLITLFDYPEDIRKAIYTTNAIECHHRCNKSSKHQFNLTSRLTLFWPIVFLLVSSREQRHDQSRG